MTYSGTFAAAVNGAGMSGYYQWYADDTPSNNTTTVSVYLYVSKSSSYSATYSQGFSGDINFNYSGSDHHNYVGGSQGANSGYLSIAPGTVNQMVMSATAVIQHDLAGNQAIQITADFYDAFATSNTWSSSFGGTGVSLTSFTRTPSTPAAPTVTRTSPYSTIIVQSAASTAVGGSPSAAITDYEYQEATTPTGFGSSMSMGGTAGRVTLTGKSVSQFYYYRTRGISTAGGGSWSAATASYVPPAFTNITIPPTGYPAQAYSGQVTATNATSYAVSSGSLPTGVTLNTSTGAISGTASTPGSYTFGIRAIGLGGSTEITSSPRTVFIGQTGPMVSTDGATFGQRTYAKVYTGSTWQQAIVSVYDPTYVPNNGWRPIA